MLFQVFTTWPNLGIFHKNSKSHVLDAKLTPAKFPALARKHGGATTSQLSSCNVIIICWRPGRENWPGEKKTKQKPNKNLLLPAFPISKEERLETIELFCCSFVCLVGERKKKKEKKPNQRGQTRVDTQP